MPEVFSVIDRGARRDRSLRLGGMVLALVTAGAVLAFGGVLPIAFACMEAGVLVAAVLCFWNGCSPVPRPALFVLGVLVLAPLLQLVPLPPALAATVSPNRLFFTERLFSSLAPPPAWVRLSLNPHATEVALLKLIAYVLAFLIANRLAAHGHSRILLHSLLVIGLLESAYGIIQYLADWQYIFTYKKTAYTADATGTYINRNHFAGLLEMVLPFMLAAVLFRPRRGAGTATMKRRLLSVVSSTDSSKVLALAMLFGVLCLALIFSRSRMGIVAAMTGLLVVGLLHFLRHRRRSVLGLLLLLLLIPGAYALWIGTDAVISRFEMLSRAGAMEHDRLPVWRDTLQGIRDFKWVGTGLGAYESVFGRYQTNLLDSRYEHAHSDYLEFACELGVPVALLLFGSLWALAACAARAAVVLNRHEDRLLAAGSTGALVAILLHSVTDFNLQIPANALWFSCIAGTAAGAATALRTNPRVAPLPDRGPRLGLDRQGMDGGA